jgi:predicted TIM-barrel fold metal-dependent hydrolase
MIDINVSFGVWPFQPNRMATVARLAAHFRREGIEQALISHLGGVLAPDPHEFNVELAKALLRRNGMDAVPIVNPRLGCWRRDLAALPGAAPISIRILPAYHDYTLRSRAARDVAWYAKDSDIPLCVQLRLDDERSRYFGLHLRVVKVDDVLALAGRIPETRFVVLNSYMDEARRILKEAPNAHVDTSFSEWLYSVEALTEGLDESRVMFGSHTPLLETRASIMKVFDGHESLATRRRIGVTNAKRVFGL